MAITTNAICNSFKKELLEGAHKFQAAPNGSTYKLAMFTNSASLGKSTVGYSTSNEVSSPSGYSAELFKRTRQSIQPLQREV